MILKFKTGNTTINEAGKVVISHTRSRSRGHVLDACTMRSSTPADEIT